MKTVVVRKYGNRRLYDTTNSRYVNLDEIATLVREGADVQVFDARNGANLTRLVLTQIIVEEAKEQECSLPQDLLRQLVIASGRASRETFADFVRAVTDWYSPAAIAQPCGDESSKAAHPPPTEGEVSKLRHRIEELERRLAAAGKHVRASRDR